MSDTLEEEDEDEEDESEEDEEEEEEVEEEECFETDEPQCFNLQDSNRPVVYLEIGSHESRIGVWNEKENSFELRLERE